MNQTYSVASDRQAHLACLPYAVGHSANEGVCLLVQMGPHRVLLDCGLSDLSVFHTAPSPPVDFVLATHAHPDHARGLLAFHRTFPKVPIYASEVTAQLLPLNWLDRDPSEIQNFCHRLPWRSPVAFRAGLSAELFHAGHLPGAAAVVLTYTTPERAYRLLYTGDFFLSNSRLVEGLSIEALRGVSPDILIIEGSYGTARHPHRRQQENTLMERLSRLLDSGKNLLLPVPPFGIAQEILVLLRSHHQFTGRDLDIWVDGNLVTACDTYLELLNYFPPAVQNFAKHQPLFWDERVRPRMHKITEQQDHRSSKLPCIVVTDATADWEQYCTPDLENWVVLLPALPQPSFPQLNSTQLRVETYLLAQHSDGLGTTQLIHNLRPQHVIFVHGSRSYLADLTGLEELQSRYHLHLPARGKLVELPIGDTFIRPEVPPETSYEGEVSEQETVVSIALPGELTSDPRWHSFADTGVIRARWQGEELVLRGVSQRELINQTTQEKLPTDIDCCANCRFYQDRHCRNPNSPLYNFQVTPEGYCMVFAPRAEE